MYSQEDYADALAQLLPPGAAWAADGTPLGAVLAGLSAELARVDARADVLLREADPGQAQELLTEWETVLGLPDPCLTESQTVAERRSSARRRLTMQAGQSAAFYIGLAASLGYTVTVEDFSSAAEATAAGLLVSGDSWAYTWRVNVAAGTSVRAFKAGGSAAGDPLRSWGVEELECLIKRFAPAHTVVLFAYS